jgi:hypothetical protein
MKVSLLCMTIAFATHASAAQYCVSSDTGLVSALSSAAASLEADEIRLVQGNISVNSDIAPNQINGALSLRGGYLSGCSTRPSSGSKTVLSGTARNFYLFLNDDNLLIERLDFVGQSLVSISGNIANPLISMILVTRSRFLNAPFLIASYSHDVRVENSLFVGGGLKIEGYYTGFTQRYGAISVVNCTSVGAATGISLLQAWGPSSIVPPAPVLLNTISYGNTTDLDLRTPTLLSHNIYRSIHLEQNGLVTSQSQANLRVDPMLDANYRPVLSSPAINSGSNDAFPLGPIEKVVDYAGNPRRVGAAIDRGAYETTGVMLPGSL